MVVSLLHRNNAKSEGALPYFSGPGPLSWPAVVPAAMTVSSAHQQAPHTSLVDIIDFKWLMAGIGHKVHVERLQTDPAYALACLGCGAQSRVPALRAASRRLARHMGVSLPDAPPSTA